MITPDNDNNKVPESFKDICQKYDAKVIQKLYKKVTGDDGNLIDKDVFPVGLVQAIYDAISGMRLDDILTHYNYLNVAYKGTSEDTRIAIPIGHRRTNLIIQYTDYNNETIVEQYKGTTINDKDWSDSNNWETPFREGNFIVKVREQKLQELIGVILREKDVIEIIKEVSESTIQQSVDLVNETKERVDNIDIDISNINKDIISINKDIDKTNDTIEKHVINLNRDISTLSKELSIESKERVEDVIQINKAIEAEEKARIKDVSNINKEIANINKDITSVNKNLNDQLNEVKGDYATKKEVNDRITSLINSAPEALDTLGEIADALSKDNDAIKAINQVLTGKADKSDTYTKRDIDTKVSNINKSISDVNNAADAINDKVNNLKNEVNQYITENNTNINEINKNIKQINTNVTNITNITNNLETTIEEKIDEKIDEITGSTSGVKSIKVNSLSYTPDENGVVTLPDYPEETAIKEIIKQPTVIQYINNYLKREVINTNVTLYPIINKFILKGSESRFDNKVFLSPNTGFYFDKNINKNEDENFVDEFNVLDGNGEIVNLYKIGYNINDRDKWGIIYSEDEHYFDDFTLSKFNSVVSNTAALGKIPFITYDTEQTDNNGNKIYLTILDTEKINITLNKKNKYFKAYSYNSSTSKLYTTLETNVYSGNRISNTLESINYNTIINWGIGNDMLNNIKNVVFGDVSIEPASSSNHVNLIFTIELQNLYVVNSSAAGMSYRIHYTEPQDFMDPRARETITSQVLNTYKNDTTFTKISDNKYKVVYKGSVSGEVMTIVPILDLATNQANVDSSFRITGDSCYIIDRRDRNNPTIQKITSDNYKTYIDLIRQGL